MSANNQK